MRPLRLNRQLATACLASATLLAATGRAVVAQESQPDFSWQGQVPSGAWLLVKNLNGPIRVEESTSGKIEVTATKHYRRGDPKDVRFEVKKVGAGQNDVLICALWFEDSYCDERGYHSDNHGRNTGDVSVDFVVRLPKGTRVDVSTVNGSLNVSGATAEVRASTVNGGIEASSTGGPVSASTVNGSVRARMGTVGTEDLHYSTVNGSVTVELPESLDADLDLSTVNGSLSSDYPMTVEGRITPRHIRATIGKGGRQLRVSTVNGSVRLIKRG
jgi:Putative adhesin